MSYAASGGLLRSFRVSQAGLRHRGTAIDRPFEERPDRFSQCRPERGQLVVDVRGHGGKDGALHQAVLFEVLEPEREHTLRNAVDRTLKVAVEYNHGIPAVLKNALDHVYAEFNRKPATFVGYGNAGGARAIEQLRSMLVELQVAPLRGAVHLSREQFVGILLDGKTFADFAPLEQAGEAMLSELIWWAEALRAGRGRAFNVPLVFAR